jgi:hypothetical protein
VNKQEFICTSTFEIEALAQKHLGLTVDLHTFEEWPLFSFNLRRELITLMKNKEYGIDLTISSIMAELLDRGILEEGMYLIKR